MRKLIRLEPPDWWAEFEDRCNKELHELFSSSPHETIPSRYLSTSRFYRDTRRRRRTVSLLAEASRGTCHACGGDMLTSDPQLEHFRPKLNAANHRKDRGSPRHYWWLLADWNNLQVLCPVCNRHKRNLFPVVGPRVAEGARGEELAREDALLINPFDNDPLDHIAMNSRGRLFPLTDRGHATVEVYALNRENLVERRSTVLRRYRSLIPTNQRRLRSQDEKAHLIERLLDLADASDVGFVPLIVDSLVKVAGATPKSELSGQTAGKRGMSRPASVFQEDLETGWIKDVEIRDFGPIEALDISFASIKSDKEPWLGIVGENGVGKSSFLKAIALALTDEMTAQTLVKDASKLKNRNSRRRSGFVEIRMSDNKKRRLTVRSKSPTLEYSGDQINIPVIALGASRITSRKGAAKNLPISTAVDNLFDPVLPLADTEEWLADTSRVASGDFSVLGDNLKSLMDLPISTQVTRRNGTIYFRRQNSRLSLEEMSDGFRSVIGLTAHIMKYLAAETPVMSEAEGTVLLDELELHLHPLWKIQIVTKLRELFPRVRFIITTHDPLCLHGFEAEETHVLRQNPDTEKIEAHTLTIRPGMTVDDLLTGGWFGLGTTYDQDTEDKIHELSALRLKEDAFKLKPNETLPVDDQAAIQELSSVLSERLAGFSNSETEKVALSKVARAAVDFGDDETIKTIDASLLQDRIKAAFGKGK